MNSFTSAAVVELASDPSRNLFETLVKNFRAMDEAVQTLALRCWRVTAFSVLALPRNSVLRREMVVKLLTTGAAGGRDGVLLPSEATAGCAGAYMPSERGGAVAISTPRAV